MGFLTLQRCQLTICYAMRQVGGSSDCYIKVPRASPSDLMEAIIVRNSLFPDNIFLVAAQEAREAPFVYLATDKGIQGPTMGSGLQEVEITFMLLLSLFLQDLLDEAGQRNCRNVDNLGITNVAEDIWDNVGVLFTH